MTHASRLLILLAVAACAVTRPIDVTPQPGALSTHLATHRPADLLVTDSAGRTRWLYSARLDGDTLRGTRLRDVRTERVAIPLVHVRSLAVPSFSAGRTLGLVGAMFAVVGYVALTAPKPQF